MATADVTIFHSSVGINNDKVIVWRETWHHQGRTSPTDFSGTGEISGNASPICKNKVSHSDANASDVIEYVAA